MRAKKSRVSIGFCARLYPSGTILTLLFSTQINEFGLLFSQAEFVQVGDEDVLEHSTLELVRGESQRHRHHIPFLEPELCHLSQHRCHELVFKLTSHFLQHDVALRELSVLTLLALYSEAFALLYYSHNFSLHKKLSIRLSEGQAASLPHISDDGGKGREKMVEILKKK